jgi:hypothetical protein
MSRAEKSIKAACKVKSHRQNFMAAHDQGGEKAMTKVLLQKKAECPQESHIFLAAHNEVLGLARKSHKA